MNRSIQRLLARITNGGTRREGEGLDLSALDPDDLPWAGAEELFTALELTGVVAELARLTGFPESAWGEIGRPLVEGFAESVQLAPASEAHHDCGPGGLLRHSLRVAVVALKLRQGKSLPPGVAPEEEHERRHRWTYGVLLGALLHDVGKMVALVQLRARGEGGGKPWTPLSSPWSPEQAPRYAMAWVKAPYRLHEQVSPIIAGRLVPARAMGWLTEDLELLGELSALLYGDTENAGALGAIVREADGKTTAAALGANVQTPTMAGVTAIPLADRLMQALKALVVECKSNRDGGWLWVDETDAYLVCVPAMEAALEWLKSEGVDGIPKDRNRLFDALQEFGYLTPTADDRAVWRIRVDGPGGAYRHDFTMLRIPVLRLFRPERRPAPFGGTLSEVGQGEVPPSSPPAARPAEEPPAVVESSPPLPDLTAPPAPPAVAEPPPPEIPSAPTPTPQPAPPAAAPPVAPVVPTAPVSSPEPSPTDTVSPGSTPIEGDDPKTSRPTPRPLPDDLPELALRFLSWLQEGLAAEGELAFNGSRARIHMVAEGLLVVSPATFRDAALAMGGGVEFEEVQRAAKKIGLMKRVDGTSRTDIIRYHIKGKKGQLMKTQLRGMVITNPGRFFDGLPTPNPALVITQPKR